MANTWPVVSGAGSVSSGYLNKGVTTLRWGTTGLLQSPKRASGFYVVTRFRQAAVVDNIKLEDGMGWTETRVQLVDGARWEVTVRDDTAMTPPVEGDTVVVTDAAGMIDPSSGDPAVANVFNATVVSPSYGASPKQPGERTLVVENLVKVESQVKGTPV